ncbi:hypothetical protein JCM1841_006761 [Sporobolomyces salmonicolor]
MGPASFLPSVAPHSPHSPHSKAPDAHQRSVVLRLLLKPQARRPAIFCPSARRDQIPRPPSLRPPRSSPSSGLKNASSPFFPLFDSSSTIRHSPHPGCSKALLRNVSIAELGRDSAFSGRKLSPNQVSKAAVHGAAVAMV